MKHKIFGYGEIGKAIGKCLSEYSIKEKNFEHGDVECYCLHVCFFCDGFHDIVSAEIERSGAEVVIIHSTVIPGTTKKLQDKYPLVEVVHSPVIGVHPDLYKGLKTFFKFIGCDRDYRKAVDCIDFDMNLIHIPIMNSEITEKLKLLSTTYYGVCIAMHQYAKDLLGNNFDRFEEWNENYNSGYQELNMGNVARPILYAPNGKIGGHCVIPNAKILKEVLPHELLDAILKYE